MNGYYNKPEETKKAWDEDGFLHTGDIAYYDEDYCFYVVDRIKDLMKYQSWHVSVFIVQELFEYLKATNANDLNKREQYSKVIIVTQVSEEGTSSLELHIFDYS